MSQAEAKKITDDQQMIDPITSASDGVSDGTPAGQKSMYAEFARQLIQRKTEILNLRDSARANMEEQVMTSPGDDADLSVIDLSADFFSRLASHHQRELVEIQDALERIQRGTYGQCESCSENIGRGRLRYLPFARLCVDCQSAEEKGRMVAFPQAKPTL